MIRNNQTDRSYKMLSFLSQYKWRITNEWYNQIDVLVLLSSPFLSSFVFVSGRSHHSFRHQQRPALFPLTIATNITQPLISTSSFHYMSLTPLHNSHYCVCLSTPHWQPPSSQTLPLFPLVIYGIWALAD